MNEKEQETLHLQETLRLIQHEQLFLNQQRQKDRHILQEHSLQNGTKENQIKDSSQEALWESYFMRRQHEQDLLLRYHSIEAQEKRLKKLNVMQHTPYFARIDFTEENEKNSFYIGLASLRDKSDEPFVVDWRSPIANLYYESELGPSFYKTKNETISVHLYLKRQFKILKGKLLSMVDTSSTISDDFLLDVLEENASRHMKNIVSTIQKEQNQIIRNTKSQVMVIEGIAGSGKTSALLQRIAYLLYTHRDWLDTKNVLLFSPNHLFSEYIAQVLPSLGENEVPTETFLSYFQYLLPQFRLIKPKEQEKEFLELEKSKLTQVKASLDILPHLTDYLKKIQPHGPLFRDLKIKGETYLTKKQLRHYYQQTNPNLPIYQRISLMQEKLYKKYAGLLRDEQKKNWLKEMVENKLQDCFQQNYQLDDSEENIKRMRKKISHSIVETYFKKIKRQIDHFQFIHYRKQYFHFLSSLPESLLHDFSLTKEDIANEITALKMRFKQKTMQLEDASLFLLLQKSLAPFYLEKHARFIFIDEMQDVTPIEAYVLKTLHPNANFTFCGDLNQQIFSNTTLVHQVESIFTDKRFSHYQLTTSYRSTKEITQFAESFLNQKIQTHAPRSGKKPHVYCFSSLDTLKKQLLVSLFQKDETIQRQAILTKTTQDAYALKKELHDKETIQLITDENDYFKKDIVILPVFLAKGLEFDKVVLWLKEDTFQTEKDRLLLYTMVTRGMHEVDVFVYGTQLPFFSETQKQLYIAH